MEFINWLEQVIEDKPNLSVFITKLKPFFIETGFNGIEFEKKVNVGLKACETDVDKLLEGVSNVEN